MSGRLDGRHRRQHSPSCAPARVDDCAAAVSLPQQCGPATGAGVFAGRNAVGGAAVLAGMAAGPLHAPDLVMTLLAFPWIGFLRLWRLV